MLFRVTKPFISIDGQFRKVGDTIECDLSYGAKLKQYGNVSGVVHPRIETAMMINPVSEAQISIENAIVKHKKYEKRSGKK
jgi:hypothetical protein